MRDPANPDSPPPTERKELLELQARLHALSDAGRPAAVERRRKSGQRTVRENLADLLDPGSLVEYGAHAVAAQRQRLDEEELRAQSPADGIVCGFGTVNAGLHGEERDYFFPKTAWSPSSCPASPSRSARA